MAKAIYVRRAQFAPGVVLSDLEAALSDPDFDGLHGKAWGKLLSHAFISRYIAAVNRRTVQQQAGDPMERCKAAYYLYKSSPDLAVPVLVELLADPNVREKAAAVLDEWNRDIVNRPADRWTAADWELVDAVLVAAKAALTGAVNPPARNSYCWSDLTSLVIGLETLVKCS